MKLTLDLTSAEDDQRFEAPITQAQSEIDRFLGDRVQHDGGDRRSVPDRRGRYMLSAST